MSNGPIFGEPGKNILMYEEHRHKIVGGEFGTHVTVLACPPEYHPPIMLYAVQRGYTTFNGFLTILCTLEEFERFIVALDKNDVIALLEVGLMPRVLDDEQWKEAVAKAKEQTVAAMERMEEKKVGHFADDPK